MTHPQSLTLTFPAAGRRRRRRLLAAAALLTAMIVAGPVTAAHAGSDEQLSNDSTGKWAYLEFPTRAYANPSADSRALGRLRLMTEDRTDELLFAEARTFVNGAWWVRVRLPFRPTGKVGWVPESKLGPYQTVRSHLIINRTTLRATLVRSGKIVFRARVGVGKRSTPTPRGEFYIRSRLSNFGSGSVYGPLAFGTSARSRTLTDWPGGGFIGIHGTNEPNLIPGRPSHGCIRMRNADIRRLDKLMSVGTPVTVT
jgi:hypothetical protein